ncbi:hypothetical protein ANN_23552 [Periplaneta americana]|uniref:Uncharacterized protein n=1 Tax=Periplaneta americana TaxID=6978 RepID=A0ABQ8SLE6_PERAM|nr:hypothetical protein ANN_23552 [Periplaneta americana]
MNKLCCTTVRISSVTYIAYVCGAAFVQISDVSLSATLLDPYRQNEIDSIEKVQRKEEKYVKMGKGHASSVELVTAIWYLARWWNIIGEEGNVNDGDEDGCSIFKISLLVLLPMTDSNSGKEQAERVFVYGQAGGNSREAAQMYRPTYPDKQHHLHHTHEHHFGLFLE